MNQPNIGVDIDDFGLPTKAGLRLAADLQFRSIELATVTGDLAPESLSGSGRRHLARLVDGHGLKLAALVGDTPELRLTDSRTVDERVERTCRILTLAADLKVPVVTASVGALTHPETRAPSPLAMEGLRKIGECADALGVLYALRPSRNIGDRVAGVLAELACPSIRLCLDPAAVVMNGANPMASIERFVDCIALLHARDGTSGNSEEVGRETHLGEGDVDLVGLFAALGAAEYAGPYIIRRLDSPTPLPDIQKARDTLTRLLPPG